MVPRDGTRCRDPLPCGHAKASASGAGRVLDGPARHHSVLSKPGVAQDELCGEAEAPNAIDSAFPGEGSVAIPWPRLTGA